MTIADRYIRGARPGDNRYSEFIRYVRGPLRILNKRRSGRFGRKHPRYLAKGGVKK